MVVGVDVEPMAVRAAKDYVARRTINKPIEVHAGDIRHLTFGDEEFDLVVDCMTSQHLPFAEHAALYAEYRRMLKSGGRFWLYHLDCKTVSTRGEWKGGCDWAGLALFPDVGFCCLPTSTELSDVVEAAGFRMTTMRWLAREYPGGNVAHYSIIEAEC